MGQVLHPLMVYNFHADQNVRSSNEYHLGDGNVTSQLFPGCVFWFPGTTVPDTDQHDCFWSTLSPTHDSHDNFRGWRVGGYFREKALREFRFAARRQSVHSCPLGHRHTQHTAHPADAACGTPSHTSWLEVRYMSLISWVHNRLEANGWANTQNFQSFLSDWNGILRRWYGVRVLWFSVSLKTSDGVHDRFLNRNDWVLFHWDEPPVTGATLHDHMRITGWSIAGATTFNPGSRFVDGDFNWPGAGQNWTLYNIATMPTGGPV
jgi:hypothetical protein